MSRQKKNALLTVTTTERTLAQILREHRYWHAQKYNTYSVQLIFDNVYQEGENVLTQL